MRRIKYFLVFAAVLLAAAMFSVGCAKNPVGPQASNFVPQGYKVVFQDSTVQICMPTSTDQIPSFEVGMADSNSSKIAPTQAMASWVGGTRLRYYWDTDNDFRIEYRTPQSCCYRVSYTYALYYALKMVNKPLIVYSIGANADGSVNWRIIIGGSAVRWLSPISSWILAAQAEMQSYN